jgi:NAD(P)-dependent dehydrogenase (short-subunit alcohol dehydrogenase family)
VRGRPTRTLDDKVVVVTGAASGIGRALAVEVAGRGAVLAISDIDDAGLAQTVDQVKSVARREVRADHLDVSDRAAVAAYAAAVVAQFGRVNVVVNNAGVALSGDVEDLDYDDMQWIMGINFWGVVHGTKEFLPHLIASGDGHVVNMSSLFGLVSMPGQSMYNSAKYAVRGFTEALREEMLVSGHRVRVTAVHPGGVKTAIARNARYAEPEDAVESARHFDEKMATMEPEQAARIIVEKALLGGKPRLLVGLDAHVIHQAARLTGSRYQDVVAAVARRTRPPKRQG